MNPQSTQTATGRTAVGIGSSGLVRSVQISEKLLETRDAVKRLMGDRWPINLNQMRPIIEGIMKRSGEDNVLRAVLPIAKEMKDNGESPALLLAVACEMADPSSPNTD